MAEELRTTVGILPTTTLLGIIALVGLVTWLAQGILGGNIGWRDRKKQLENLGDFMPIWLILFLCECIVFWVLYFISFMFFWTHILMICVFVLGLVFSVVFSKRGNRASAAFRHTLALLAFCFFSSMIIGVQSRESLRLDEICRNGLNEPRIEDKRLCYEEGNSWLQRVYRLESCTKLKAEIDEMSEP